MVQRFYFKNLFEHCPEPCVRHMDLFIEELRKMSFETRKLNDINRDMKLLMYAIINILFF